MQDLSKNLPFGRASMIAAISNILPKETLDELNFFQKKIETHIQEHPVIDQSAEVSTIMQRSVRFAQELAESGVMIPYLVAGSTCRKLTFKGKGEPNGSTLPVNGTRMTSFKITSIGKANAHGLIRWDESPEAEWRDTWIRVFTSNGHTSYTACGPSKSLIEDKLISHSKHYRTATDNLSSTLQLLLPVHGDNLLQHKKPSNIVNAYLADVPYDRLLALKDNEENTKKIELMTAQAYETRRRASSLVQAHEDFREIIEISNPMRDYSRHEQESISIALLNGLSRIPNALAKPVSAILTRLAAIPDEEDRAIAWLGLTNGGWTIPA